MSAPEQVWIDERVARGMAGEKDLELAERGIEQVCYVRDDVAADMVRQAAAHQPDEFIVSIWGRRNERNQDRVVALTNHGRVFVEVTGGWRELPGPELNQ